MAWPSETGNTFTIPVTGGAGPCPNGAMRSGMLTLTCSAASTTFNVVENPMCTYAMTYTTTQPCPNYIAPSPPPPSVQPGGWSYQGCFNDASARTLPVLLSTSANVQQCQALGRSGGYNVVGAEWQGECWVSGPFVVAQSMCSELERTRGCEHARANAASFMLR